MATGRKFDIVVFGASGFTGQYVVEEMARIGEEERGLKWAVAGRNKTKLEKVLKEASSQTGKDLGSVGLIEADVNDADSLRDMCRQTKLLLNCVGPYRFWGEKVVEQAVENGCHHIDISGEPQYLEGIVLNYMEKARENGVYVVECCGFDSIPAEMGIQFAKNTFPGQINSIDSFLMINVGPEGGKVNSGTWQSAVHGIANHSSLGKLRKQFNYKPLPKLAPRLKKRSRVCFADEVGRWCVPFQGSDVAVIRRTQRFMYEELGQRPIQFGAYFTLPKLLYIFFLMIFGLIFGILASFSFGRKLLIKYPGLFSMGIFSNEGPSRKQVEGASFSMKLFCQGWSNKDDLDAKVNTKMAVQVAGPEPGYVSTPIAMVQAALTVLKETDKLPSSGGVYTPGQAFYRTTLIDRLNIHGLKFSLLSDAKPI